MNELESYKQLCCGILLEAVRSWKRYQAHHKAHTKQGKLDLEIASICGFRWPREELLTFFYSEWCVHLCLHADIDYPTMIKELEIPFENREHRREYRNDKSRKVRTLR